MSLDQLLIPAGTPVGSWLNVHAHRFIMDGGTSGQIIQSVDANGTFGWTAAPPSPVVSTLAMTATGPFAIPVNFNLNVVVQGTQCTLNFPAIIGSAASSAALMTITPDLPSNLRPSPGQFEVNYVVDPICGSSGGAATYCSTTIGSDGSISIGVGAASPYIRDSFGGNFGTTGLNGSEAFSMSYSLVAT